MQVNPEAQSIMPVHEVRHAFVVVSHLYGVQLTAMPVMHMPVALHVCNFTFAIPMHMEGPQVVPTGHLEQLPAPLHFPSVPQVDAAWVAHTRRGSAPPAGTGRQVPGSLATLHE